MVMKALRKCMILCVIIGTAAGVFSGCSSQQREDRKEERPQLLAAANHLEEWEEELPADAADGVISSASVRGLVIRKDGEISFAVSYEPREEKESFDYWDISVPYQSLVSVNTEELYRLFELVIPLFAADGGESVQISREDAGITEDGTSVFLAYDGRQSEGEKGFPQPTQAKRIFIGREDGQGNYYISREGEETVYLADRELVDAVLGADPYEYILKIPVLVSIDTVSRVQILTDGQMHVMEYRTSEQGDRRWEIDGKSVKQEELQELYGKLLGIMIADRLPEEFMPEKDREPVLTLQFFRNIEGASDIEVKYYAYDGEQMSVSVNGQEYFLADSGEVREVIKAAEEL